MTTEVPLDTVLCINKLNLFPVQRGCAPVPVLQNCVVISPCFAIFKNVIHSFEPGEMPSDSASHRAPNYAQHS